MNDANGVDRLQGVGADRSEVLAQEAVIRYSGTNLRPVVQNSDILTLVVTGNSVASAELAVTLVFATDAV